MSYFGAAILTLFLLGLTSAGWYCLFKRFERRMSSRFDDLVERHEETMKSIGILQGIALVIKHDRFLDHAREMEQAYRENGRIDGQSLDKLEKLIGELRLENYSRF